MSIQTEINRISNNVSDTLDAIEAKGVTIPAGANSDDMAGLVSQIEGGGGDDWLVVDSFPYTCTDAEYAKIAKIGGKIHVNTNLGLYDGPYVVYHQDSSDNYVFYRIITTGGSSAKGRLSTSTWSITLNSTTKVLAEPYKISAEITSPVSSSADDGKYALTVTKSGSTISSAEWEKQTGGEEQPVIQISSSQIISVDPIKFQLTDAQGALLEDCVDTFYLDLSLIGQPSRTFMFCLNTATERKFTAVSAEGDAGTVDSAIYNYSTKIATYSRVDLQPELTAGQNITISNNVISATGGGSSYTAGDHIDITNNVISAVNVADILTIAISPMQLITYESPYEVQLTNEQYAAFEEKPIIMKLDMSQCGLQDVYLKYHTDSDSEFWYVAPFENGCDVCKVAKGTKIAVYDTEFYVDPDNVTYLSQQIGALYAGKQDKLTAGTNITIDSNNVISATGGGSSYTFTNGLTESGGTVSVDSTVLRTTGTNKIKNPNYDSAYGFIKAKGVGYQNKTPILSLGASTDTGTSDFEYVSIGNDYVTLENRVSTFYPATNGTVNLGRTSGPNKWAFKNLYLTGAVEAQSLTDGTTTKTMTELLNSRATHPVEYAYVQYPQDTDIHKACNNLGVPHVYENGHFVIVKKEGVTVYKEDESVVIADSDNVVHPYDYEVGDYFHIYVMGESPYTLQSQLFRVVSIEEEGLRELTLRAKSVSEQWNSGTGEGLTLTNNTDETTAYWTVPVPEGLFGADDETKSFTIQVDRPASTSISGTFDERLLGAPSDNKFYGMRNDKWSSFTPLPQNAPWDTGTYTLKCTVNSSHVPSYSWVKDE